MKKYILAVVWCIFPFESNARWCRAPGPWETQRTSPACSYINNLPCDYLNVAKFIFSADTLKVAVFFVPAFILLGWNLDEPLHDIFYCYQHHRNKHACQRFNKFCGSNITYAIVLGSLTLPWIFSKNEKLNTTSRLFFEMLPFIVLLKKAVRAIRHDFNARPLCEWFPQKKSYTGFPSGHLMTYVFAATLFGSQFGAAAAVPLGLWAGVTFIDFLACNRHTPSQMIAGAGFGLILGLASAKVIERHLSQSVKVSINPSDSGISCSLNYDF